jgi:hypothetical protein
MDRDEARHDLDARSRPEAADSPLLAPLFLLLVSLPLLAMLLGLAPTDANVENRKLADPPAFSWQRPLDHLGGLASWFNDRFAFRGRLVRGYNRLLHGLFHVSPSDRIVIGRQGWLYLGRGNYFNNEMDYYRSIRPFTLPELQRFKATLEERRDWLARRGIRYLFVPAPNKSSIYPEYLPAAINRVHARSRLDQLLDYLRRRSDVEFLDLRPELLRRKAGERLYHKTDSHWNDLGGYWAYREIAERLRRFFPALRPLPPGELVVGRRAGPGGDLARLLDLQQDVLRETYITARPRVPIPLRTGKPTPGFRPRAPWVKLVASECPAGEVASAVMVRDSFAHQLMPFLSRHFRRIVYVWDWELHVFPDVIAKEKPSVVIDQMAERSLLNILPKNPPSFAAERP